MYRMLLTLSIASENGVIAADVAGPPSPSPSLPRLQTPLPAIVVMTPVLFVTSRTRLLPKSATYTFADASTATKWSELRRADVAGPPSPENTEYDDGVPAMTLHVAVRPSAMVQLVDSTIVYAVQVAHGIDVQILDE
jgi:hypothetical protein